MATATEIGDGSNTLFWCDRWIMGQCIEDISPIIFSMIPRRIANRRTVADALTDFAWVRDIHGVATIEVIFEFLHLWDLITQVNLQPEAPDVHIWHLTSSGKYSAQLAYEALFQGSTLFSLWERIWKTWAPNKCKFFMWLVTHNRCWMTDRLERRSLAHPDRCPFCDQEDETIHHLLIGCVFARQFWVIALQRIGLAALSPQPTDNHFDEWWYQISSLVSGTTQQGLNSIVILGAWTLWRHRNDYVFNKAAPSIGTALFLASEETKMWSMVGAKALSSLTSVGGHGDED
ncbi:hypothetical protein PR202_gb03439 [Eleusine coracana subsp. coracana]|uniref:Reverse transcriptase zinc-binding domain-containing protein n=1 Tax=Eleusine coracana subsp. coracana TaxID=191504 RepID=A0AAV5E2V9_ELECO|nr:hypothetical protein PR202_gb03439 [Eleusine coracana subsp. coracana]